MTVQELNNEFDIHYNSIASQSAPGLDAYEKSVYLTKAQLELIKDYYNPLGNKYQDGFEQSEKRRVDLKRIVKTTTASSWINGNFDQKLHPDSVIYTIPEEVFLIVQEQLRVVTTTLNDCMSDKILQVRPITHDEFNIQIRNPFKKPDESIAWRLDMQYIPNMNKCVEIISPLFKYSNVNYLEYKIRYIKYPKPIILQNLNTLFPGEGLTIDGQFLPMTSELDQELHREIVDRAVELALADYKPSNLQTKIQLDNRNE